MRAQQEIWSLVITVVGAKIDQNRRERYLLVAFGRRGWSWLLRRD